MTYLLLSIFNITSSAPELSLFPNNNRSKYLRQSQTPHPENALFQGLPDVIWSIVPTCCVGYTHLGLYPDINMIRGIMHNEKAMHWTSTSCNRWNRRHLLNDSMVPAMATAGFTNGMTWIHKPNNDLHYLSWSPQASRKSVRFGLMILNYSISFSGFYKWKKFQCVINVLHPNRAQTVYLSNRIFYFVKTALKVK